MKYFVTLFLLFTTGCAYNYDKYYENTSPIKFEKTDNTVIHYLNNKNASLDDVYNKYYSDLLKQGNLIKYSEGENVKNFQKYAKKVGADIVLLKDKFVDSYEYTDYINVPKSATSNSTYSGTTSYMSSSPMTSYGNYSGTTTYNYSESVPYTRVINMYEFKALFLKNINNVKLPWEYTKKDFGNPLNISDKYTGKWKSEGYEIEINKYKGEYIAFITATHSKKFYFFDSNEKPVEVNKHLKWNVDDLKFRFNDKTLNGIYIMGSKTPKEINVEINKFGFLEIKTDKETFSFMKNN